MSIHQAIWLFPVCVAVHFVEEAPRFAAWARRHISERYTDAHWRRIHMLGLLSAVAASAVASWWPIPLTAFLFTACFVVPMIFNATFHAAASICFRSYSPGVVSAVCLFPVLGWNLVGRFQAEGLLDARLAVVATVAGALFHAADLASTTFFLDRRPRLPAA